MATFQVKQGQPSFLQGLAIGGAHGIASGLSSLAEKRLKKIEKEQERAELADLFKKANLTATQELDILSSAAPEQKYGILTALLTRAGQEQQQAVRQAAPAPEPTQVEAAQQVQREQLGITPQGPPMQMQPQQISPQQLATDALALQAGEPTEIKLKQVLDEIKSMGLPRPNKQQRQEIEGMISNFNPQPIQGALPPVLPTAAPTLPQIPPAQAVQQEPAGRYAGASFAKPMTPYEKARIQQGEREYELKLSKNERENYDKIKPILEEQYKDFKAAKQIYTAAKKALDTIEKNKKKWPTVGGYLPTQLLRDPDVRDYARNINKILDVSSNAVRGNPTNFRTRIKEATKISLTEPVESQIKGLKDIIKETKDVFDTQDIINDIYEKHGERFPIHLGQKLIQRIGRPDLQTPIQAGARLSQVDKSQLPVGYPLSKNGVQYIWDGNKPVLASEYQGEQ